MMYGKQSQLCNVNFKFPDVITVLIMQSSGHVVSHFVQREYRVSQSKAQASFVSHAAL